MVLKSDEVSDFSYKWIRKNLALVLRTDHEEKTRHVPGRGSCDPMDAWLILSETTGSAGYRQSLQAQTRKRKYFPPGPLKIRKVSNSVCNILHQPLLSGLAQGLLTAIQCAFQKTVTRARAASDADAGRSRQRSRSPRPDLTEFGAQASWLGSRLSSRLSGASENSSQRI
jgi:hypothetical protein